MKKKLVVLSGAGISQESGLKTFRDMGGLWENYRVEEVATPEAWEADPGLVLQFYNERRKSLEKALPNDGHYGITALESWFDVHVITQNVDDLHEKAGSTRVLHLHGELRKARSTANPDLIYTLPGPELNLGDLCELGSQLRPHIVWFGEEVPEITRAVPIVQDAGIMVIIGTSLMVYPAAGLVHYLRPGVPLFVIDPGEPEMGNLRAVFIRKKASEGVKELTRLLMKYVDENNITQQGTAP